MTVDSDLVHETVPIKFFRLNRDSFDGASKHLQPAQYNVFTDGSKTSKGVGSGIAVYKNVQAIVHKSLSLPPNVTGFFAEVAALGAGAAEMLGKLDERKAKYVKIFCDSQAAVDNRDVRSGAVKNAVDLLNELGRKVQLTLVWVKAHNATCGNELADKLAKSGADGTGERTHTAHPFSEIKSTIKNWVGSHWENQWTTYGHARQKKQFLPVVDEKISRDICARNRREVSRLISIIIGHGPFAYHQSLICPEIDSNCRYCETETRETFFHIYTECPCFNNIRECITGLYQMSKLDHWMPQDLLDFIKNSAVREVFDLVEGTSLPGEYSSELVQPPEESSTSTASL